MTKIHLTTLIALSFLTVTPPATAQVAKPVLIASGSIAGSNYAAAGSMCQLFNKYQKASVGRSCTVLGTSASTANIEAIRSGEVDFGMGQADALREAFNGLDFFKAQGPNKDLRFVFSVNPNYLTLIAAKEANAQKFEDIKGKRVFAGKEGSGTLLLFLELLAAHKMSPSDITLVTKEVDPNNQGDALCNTKKIDFAFSALGLGATAVSSPLKICSAKIIPLIGAGAENMLKNSSVDAVELPANAYPNQPESVKTLASPATIISSTKTSPDLVYALVKSVFDNLPDFKKTHQSFAPIEPKTMIKYGQVAPIHEGALRYYKEKGWI